MTQKAQALIDEIATLSQDEKAQIATVLLRQFEDEPFEDQAEVDAAWEKEIARRVKDIESGKAKLVSWADVQREVEARLRKNR